MSPADTTLRLASLDILHQQGQPLQLKVGGGLDATTCGDLWARGLEAIRKAPGAPCVVDAAGITYCDSAGVSMLLDLERQAQDLRGTFSLQGFPEAYTPLLLLVRRGATGAGQVPPSLTRGFAEEVGHTAMSFLSDLLLLTTYLGEVVSVLCWVVTHPLKVRWRESLRHMQACGVNAFPVVALVCFLLGLILSYQTAARFESYGAQIYMADMLGISITRELGPLMTAIVLTARSASAFAAEIGTMKVNEEVDALTTMGIDPVRFLVTPRIIAAVIMTPILTIFANVMALIGGLPIWLGDLHLSLDLYQAQLQSALSTGDVLGGIVKASVFGLLVASVGCIRGLQTRGGALAVGTSTTSAVVSGIVLISVVDMIFARVYYSLGI